ncbi:MAG: PEGA domain-containing protein [Deltaproteobacteria bacterium]
MRSYHQFALGLGLASGLFGPSAGAASVCESERVAGARELAKAHYSAGISAYQERRYRDAIDELSCANQLLKSHAFSYNIAVTYEAMGDAASALRWYREHAREGGSEVDTPALRAKLAELEAKLQSRGIQQVTLLSVPSGAILSIDDEASGLTPFSVELRPGRHRYRLTATGHEVTEGWFELRADRALDVRVELTPAAEKKPPVPLEALQSLPRITPSASDTPGPFAAIGTWTWVSLGSGVALLGGGLAFEWRRRQLEHTLESGSQVDYQERYDAMSTPQTSARILAGLGSAALLTGGVLAVLDLSRGAPERELQLTACAGPELCIAASGAF